MPNHPAPPKPAGASPLDAGHLRCGFGDPGRAVCVFDAARLRSILCLDSVAVLHRGRTRARGWLRLGDILVGLLVTSPENQRRCRGQLAGTLQRRGRRQPLASDVGRHQDHTTASGQQAPVVVMNRE